MKKVINSNKQRMNKLDMLIRACMERYSEKEMLDMFGAINDKIYAEDKDTEDLISDLVEQGYCIFKPDNSNQGDKLKEYAETYIFPYYNEQMTAILF